MVMPEPVPARPVTPFADGSFGTRASELNRFVIEASRLAVRNARRPAVRAIAQRLVAAHMPDMQNLQQMAERQGGSLPASLTTRAQTMMADLEKSRRAFDHDYLLDMINAHQDLVSAYRAEMSEGGNSDLKGFATANLGPTERHLAELMRLAGQR